MQLKELIKGLDILEWQGDLSVEIDSVVYDSRKARRGSLFVCIEGFITDGHQYIEQAIEQDVSAVLLSRPQPGLAIPWVLVSDTRRGLAQVSDNFFGHPSATLDMIGITGTKGKTTSTYMTLSILREAGRKTGLIGTIANIIGDQVAFASRTTPESYDLQALLREMVDRGQDSCVMEVSSQGLMLDRVYGCKFRVGVFTNLYHDHIGPHEHNSMEEYLQAKLMLFDRCEHAVINLDCEVFETVRAAVKGPCLTYSIDRPADVAATRVRMATENGRVGTRFELKSPWFNGEIFVGMPGRFNVHNALAAIACAGLLGADIDACRRALAAIAVPGRVQPIPTGQNFQVIVDYAHNAASLKSLLETLRDYVQSRLIVIFGNGGDRARSRRFEMGDVAGRLADLSVITSDNPRTEDPMAIIQDILTGIEPTKGQFTVIPDRREAIFKTIQDARDGDMIVIAGKGHENYQIFKDKTIHFDDSEVAALAIASIEEQDHGQR